MEPGVRHMARDTDFIISLDTDKEIGSEAFARTFLDAWLNHPVEAIRPERFGRGEPVRKLITDVSFDELVEHWCRWALLFTRRTKPRMTVDLAWRREKGLDPRPFPWGLTAWLAKSAGPAAARAMFELVVEHFEPAFAHLTTQTESRRKHFMKRPHYINGQYVGVAEAFVGHHVMDTLPGIYWQTYFGPPAIARIGEERFHSIPCGRLERLGRGYVITAYDDLAMIGTLEAQEREEAIRQHLGAKRFFDVTTVASAQQPRPGTFH